MPVAEVDGALDDVAALGRATSRTRTSEDVTDTVVDLDSRLATRKAGIERLRALLERAENLDDVVLLERELTDRQVEYESLLARRAALGDQVAMATVTVELSRAAEPTSVGDAWRLGRHALLVTLAGAAVVAAALLPFALLAAAVVAAVLVPLRLRRRPRRGGQV